MKNTNAVVCLLGAMCLTACGGSHGETQHTSSTASALSSVAYRGVSLAGAEFGVDPYGNGPVPGTFAVNYMYPDAAYASGYTTPAHFVSEGMNTFRLPFRWERLQPTRDAAFDAAEL
ncbi:MAG: glycoside hydrolase family 5 protein, partial [Polyangiaceae bacterium]